MLDGIVCVVDGVFGKQVGALAELVHVLHSYSGWYQQMEIDHAQEGIGESLRSV